MRPRGNVYLFARAPALGAVKRRLAADIGDMAAWRFYRETTREVLGRIAADPRWRTRVAVTPDRFAERGRFWPDRIARVPQGHGDLGERMARVMARIPNAPAVIVGSDIPDLSAAHIAAAFAALGRNDFVFGPASDGGYWLIGARDSRTLARAFRNVRWSTRHALEDTLAGIGSGRRVAFLETLQDVDDATDFKIQQKGVRHLFS